jgi:hypothetical protein
MIISNTGMKRLEINMVYQKEMPPTRGSKLRANLFHPELFKASAD